MTEQTTLSAQDSILVVDDDHASLTQVQEILGSQYHVICFRSGQEALDDLHRTVPNLILLALFTSDLDGLAVMKQIQAQPDRKDIPVIFLLDDNWKSEAAVFHAGAMDYIRKPLLPEVVIHRVGRILALYRFQQSLLKETAELRQSNQRFKALSEQVMRTLANTIDAKDTYTRGHSVRVAEYSREIARRLGKTEQQIQNIYYMGLLHDIGKIGVPDNIVKKSDKLADQEYAVMKAHPVLGADILKDMTEIPIASIGARWHHERYDGTGYPDGLRGEEIPESARIIGVADAYDAMTSKRLYQDVLPQAVVREEIVMGRGTQFDPVIADIMLDMIDQDTDYQMREL
jgi:putative two-component system response regulator